MSTLQRLLKTRPLKTGTVTVGVESFSITELTAAQRDELTGYFRDKKPALWVNAMIACMSTEGLTAKDVDSVLSGPPDVFIPLAEGILKLSGIGADEVDEAKPGS